MENNALATDVATTLACTEADIYASQAHLELDASGDTSGAPNIHVSCGPAYSLSPWYRNSCYH